MNWAALTGGPGDGAVVSIRGLPRELHYRDAVYVPTFTDCGKLLANPDGEVVYALWCVLP